MTGITALIGRDATVNLFGFSPTDVLEQMIENVDGPTNAWDHFSIDLPQKTLIEEPSFSTRLVVRDDKGNPYARAALPIIDGVVDLGAIISSFVLARPADK